MSALPTRTVLHEVKKERASQDERWGLQRHSPAVWLAILTEEVGEVAKEVADSTAGGATLGPNYRTELVQVAAVAVAAIESIDAQ